MLRVFSVTTMLVLVLAALAGPAWAIQNDGPFENIKAATVPAVWQYSNDGGKTFGNKPHGGPMYGTRTSNHPYAWKATFDVPDPGKIAGLWVRLVEQHTHYQTPRASICNGNVDAASGGFWKDLGFCPCLLDAVITLNGKQVKIANGPVLYFWVPMDPGDLRQGKNTLEMRGNVYTYWGGGQFAEFPADSIDARLLAAEAQPAKIHSGPILGDCGDGYFTLACRTQLPADLIVETTPVEPAGPMITTISTKKIWHRVKVEIPKGTKKLTYRLVAKVGPHETKRGPWAVALPTGDNFRFAAFGNVYGHTSSIDTWSANAKVVLDWQPNLLVNTGNPMEHCPWEFFWDEFYIEPAAELLARVPSLVTPCDKDFAGVFNELHYTPAPDGYAHNWSKVLGPVRFIGLDGNETWKPSERNYKWLEKELQAAKEKYIVVLQGYPGYSSGVHSKRRNPHLDQARDVILPLLGKYKASVMLCSWDPDYERCEPTPDKGVTQIVTGCIGKASMHRWSGVIATNPFGPGPDSSPRAGSGKTTYKGHEWCGWVAVRHFLEFDVKADSMTFKLHPIGPSWWAEDHKTFKAR